MKNQAGYLVAIDPGADKPLAEYATLQCAHCGGHFVLVRPNRTSFGTVPGTCWSCGAKPICGQPACIASCTPNEVLLESIEQGVAPEKVRRYSAGGICLP